MRKLLARVLLKKKKYENVSAVSSATSHCLSIALDNMANS